MKLKVLSIISLCLVILIPIVIIDIYIKQRIMNLQMLSFSMILSFILLGIIIKMILNSINTENLLKEFKEKIEKETENMKCLIDQKKALDTHSIVAMCDIKGNIIYANKKFEEISGYTLDELMGQHHRIVNSNMQPASYWKKMYEQISKGYVWNDKVCNKNKDGSLYWVNTTIVPIMGENGKPNSYMAIRVDITEEMNLQKNLESKNNELIMITNKFQLATQAAGIGIWFYSFENNTFTADKKSLELFEMDKEMAGKQLNFSEWTSKCHLDDVDEAVHSLQQSAEKLDSFDIYYRMVMPSGIKYFHSAGIVKYEDNIPIGIVGINQDVTDSKTLEESRKIAQEAAEAANQAKSNFLANMSHEIRTPLNGVIGLTELLLETKLLPIQREYLMKSETASKALLNVLNNILDYSKIESNKMILETTTFNLNDIIENLISMLSYKAEQKNITLETNIEKNVPNIIIGDPLRLQQILSNLTVNALKFTENGYVKINITSNFISEDIEEITFSISDTGIGMNEEGLTTLFKPFSQVDTSFTRKYGGSGLGLMISKELVELMNGKLTVKSEFGKGSEFSFKVEFKKIKELKNKIEKNRNPLPKNKEINILLVEDNELNQLVATEILKKMGITKYKVANNGEESIKMVQENNFDIILMDIQMPIMNGIEATKKIRELGYKDIQIIALSAAALKNDIDMAKEAGMNYHIAKPIDSITLQNAIAKCLEKESNCNLK